MKNLLPLFILCLCFAGFSVSCQTTHNVSLKKLIEEYARQHKALDVTRRHSLSYETNLKNLPEAKKLEKQQALFKTFKQKVATINRATLSKDEQYDYDHLMYELERNSEENRLQLAFRRKKNSGISDQGMSFLPKGWYQMYVKRMTTSDISPRDLMKFGKSEVARVEAKIRAIQKKAGYGRRTAEFYQHLQSDRFNLHNLDTILARYAQLDGIVRKNLHKIFEHTESRTVKIKPIPNVTYNSPPGYLSPDRINGNTFFFKYYKNKHNWRGMDFLYLHEALPGHSYHFDWEQLKLKNLPAFHDLIWYPGYFEGWAAYVENFGKELGLYKNIYTEFGKWSWDLVRSVRIVLDVGIHHKGWSKKQALKYWKKHLPFRMDIARREIDRVTRWPAQVLSYKLGEAKLLELKHRCEQVLGVDFDLRKFHTLVMSKGQIPLTVMETMVNDFIRQTINKRKLSENKG